MVYILESPRMFLREIIPDDAEEAYNLNLDPEVIQYTGDESFKSIEKAREFLENYDSYRRFGFGRWAMIRKQDQKFLGWCGIKFNTETHEHDVGFRLFRNEWNKGYATEAARASILYGFETLNLDRIIAHAMKVNLASVRVIEKCGLKYEGPRDFDGNEGVLYALNKHEFNSEL